MGGFNRREYSPASRLPEQDTGLFSLTGLAQTLLAVVVVGVVVFAGYKLFKSTGAPSEPSASAAQVAQIGERLDGLERRLDQLEKKPRAYKEVSAPATPNPLTAPAAKPLPPNSRLSFSRPVIALSTSTSPANPSPAGDSTQKKELDSARAAAASGQQQWEATADRLGNVVGELDSQRNALDSQREALARDQARLDELAGRFARDSQPFTVEKSSTRQQVGPVGLQLIGTDPKNQRYTMRVSVEGTTVELKDRALHEAIQFYASDGKDSFELVVSQIGRDIVRGSLVLPQTTTAMR
jgi:type IV secretory pathway VirB10-like protein